MIPAGRIPLMLALVALLVTFLITRVITRMIRAGRGPFHNIGSGGVHIHHVVPGIVLMLFGGFLGIGIDGHFAASCVAAVVFGMGSGLVLDEFALVVHLHDVYWTEQGRLSVEATVLTVVAVALGVAGFVPFDVTSPDTRDAAAMASWSIGIVVTLATAAITFAKGKFRVGVVGVLVPPVNVIAAIRLARPGSPWANRFYRTRARKARRALARAHRYDARLEPVRRRFQNLIAGAPSVLTGRPRDDDQRPGGPSGAS